MAAKRSRLLTRRANATQAPIKAHPCLHCPLVIENTAVQSLVLLKTVPGAAKETADDTSTNFKGEDDSSIEVMTDGFGDGKSTCRWGRNKVFCYKPPDIDALTPIKLEYLFPELPPVANTVK